MTYRPPRCDNCRHVNPVKHQAVDRNLRVRYALLCRPCGRKLGMQPVSYDRPTSGPQQRGKAE